MARKKKFVDPYLEQEKKRYETPIPSRQSIIEYLTDLNKAVTLNHLLKVMEIYSAEQEEAVIFRLRAMLRDGQLMQDRRGRYCVLKRLDMITGTIMAHSEGFGFVIPEGGGDDLFLSAKEMRQVMHGDKVTVFEVGRDRRGRREGRIHEVIERKNTTVVGQIYSERGVFFVEPDNKRITQAIAVAPEDLNSAKQGQVVLVELISFPTKRHPALGKVVEILGEHLAPGLEIDVALLSYDIPHRWPQEVLDEVASLPTQVTDEDLHGRRDLRKHAFVTIDGEDAKDFDDAVFCQKREKTWQLMVAIADVSHYVKPGSALDKEAQYRSTSVYFPGRVVPMLPEQLSNGLCSLNPDVDRLTLVCDMSFSEDGIIKRSRFYQAVIHSKARLTYNQVSNFIETGELDHHEGIKNDLHNLYELYQILIRQRKNRGAIEFDTKETQIIFDDKKKISKIVPLIRNEAHRLIEECMLAANVCAAKFVKREKIPALYRVHQSPPEDRIEKLREFLNGFGLTFGGGKKPHPKDYASTLTEIEDKPEKGLIETVMLRSLTQARYMEKNEGHFGLAYAAYAHFTSPIRRYPDLLTHRGIIHAVNKQNSKPFYYSEQDMSHHGKHASTCERRADEATREVVSWLKCEFMQDKVGETYTGTISAVTSFGLFVMLDDFFVEGLIHLSSLRGDYYKYDSTRHKLVGESSGKQYRLGDKLKITVARVDLVERKIDFDLVLDDEQ